ncbi:hypothetical protein QE453_000187 [Agrobacterium sp. SORGH_AS440]|nr:hypothetical protein [Agrobacterium sp. SORGH_AS_0440]
MPSPNHGWGDEEPYFEELNIRVTHPAEDLPLSVGDEVVSLREALHEDFYFSLLEFFQKKSGRPLGDRGLKPGQIVPEIVKSEGEITLHIETRPLTTAFLDGGEQPIDEAREPVAAGQLAGLLEEIGGEPFQARSRSGRVLSARYVAGSDAAVMISGGQHPNETTGIVGAIRAPPANSLIARARISPSRRSKILTVTPCISVCASIIRATCIMRRGTPPLAMTSNIARRKIRLRI